MPRLPRRSAAPRTLAAALLLALWTTLAVAAPALDPQQLETSRQLLDWLGVDDIVEQTPHILDLALQSEATFRHADAATEQRWRNRITGLDNTTTLREHVARSVARAVDAQTLQRALTRLQMPLPRRARYFDLAMAQAGAGDGLARFRSQSDTGIDAARRKLVAALVDTAGSATLLAEWETTLSLAVARAAADPATDHAALRDAAVAERIRYLTPLARSYTLYAYRYLSDDELAGYRDILGDAAVQRVLEVCRHTLAQTPSL